MRDIWAHTILKFAIATEEFRMDPIKLSDIEAQIREASKGTLLKVDAWEIDLKDGGELVEALRLTGQGYTLEVFCDDGTVTARCDGGRWVRGTKAVLGWIEFVA